MAKQHSKGADKKKTEGFEKQQATKPGGPKGGMHGDEMFQKLPDPLKRAMEVLKKQESKIVDALKDEETKKLFITNPGAALSKMRIEVPPELRKQLRPNESLQRLMQDRQFRLPNGQVITAKVRINFTRGEEE